MSSDVEKRQNIERQLARQPQLDWEIFPAIVGRELTPDQITRLCSPQFYPNGNHSLAEAGCALSHRSVYQKIADENISYALVLEDDAILPPPKYLDFSDLEDILLSDEPVIIQMSCGYKYKLSNFQRKLKNERKLYRLFGSYNAVSYLINLAAAKILSEALLPIRFVADDFKEIIKLGIHTYGIVPRLVTYPDGCGEVGQSKIISKPTFSQQIKQKITQAYLKINNGIEYIRGYRNCWKKKDVPPMPWEDTPDTPN